MLLISTSTTGKAEQQGLDSGETEQLAFLTVVAQEKLGAEAMQGITLIISPFACHISLLQQV